MKKEYIIYKLSDASKEACKIDNELFPMYNVKRGLRNEDGTGVLVGLTKVGNVVGYERLPEGGLKAIPGKLFYRGYDVEDIAHGLIKEKRFGFEEVAYLLLSGKLPDKEELAGFKELICDNMPLEQKTKMNILDLEGQNIMNILARSVLEMYTFDPNPDDTSRDNLMRQSIELISRFPTIIAYAYNIYRHSQQGRSLHIRHPHENLSIAENFLHMLKKDFTDLEARTLDLLLVLQAEHGGGNNSTFTVRVTSSTGTDTYSSIAAGIGSLKGPLHGGANIQVVDMFHHLKENIADWKNVDEIDTYFMRMLNKEAYNKTGLIYGIGHAVYTISDPRAVVLKELARSVLEMYTFDPNPDDTSRDNLMRQSIELISRFPTIIAYAYNIYRHSQQGRSLHIRHPHENLSIAENFLHMLKKDFTDLEARTLDLLLVLQAEHGGGNNSTFTVRVTSSTGTDTYSSIAAGIGSLKGPLHGGANIQVVDMFHHLKENIADWKNVDEIDTYFMRMLNKEAYNKTGLIYGIGHAVYTISDPRAVVLKELARDLAKEKGREEEFAFLELLESRAIECFAKHKGTKKRVSSNVDFYSGFVYEMIGLPQEIYTPLFAMARIVGWTAHRIEELNFDGKRIIRPAYKNVLEEQPYLPIADR